MSATTQTATTTSPSVVRLLADYELTHSGGEESHNATDSPKKEEQQQQQQQQSSAASQQNPGWWPTDHHGIPPYQPIDYTLDHESRPWASSGVEIAFVMVMLNGVGTVACLAKMWRATGGRINDRIFRFSIGGER